MVPLRPIALFCLRCLVIYGILMVPWPGLSGAYISAFCAVGNTVFDRVGGEGRVHFSPLEKVEQHTKDTQVVMQVMRPGRPPGRMSISAMYLGYRTTAFVVALALATPLSWGRRGIGLAWCLLWVHLIIAFRVWLLLADAFSNQDPLRLFELSGFWKSVLRATMKVMTESPATTYILPSLIWLVTMFRREEFTEAFQRKTRAAEKK